MRLPMNTFRAPMLLLAVVAAAQPQQPNLTAQRTATKKLEFLVGKWSGEVSVIRGAGENWGRTIPRCRGNLGRYFLPYEGTNYVGWGLIAFDSRAANRARLKADPDVSPCELSGVEVCRLFGVLFEYGPMAGLTEQARNFVLAALQPWSS